jgi:hypothetical protein
LVFLGALWARLRAGAEWLAVIAQRLMVVATWESARLLVAPFLVVVGASRLAGVRYGVFGTGFNAFGAIFAASLLLGVLPSSPAGAMGVLSLLWVLVAALLLALRTRPAPRTQPAAPTVLGSD